GVPGAAAARGRIGVRALACALLRESDVPQERHPVVLGDLADLDAAAELGRGRKGDRVAAVAATGHGSAAGVLPDVDLVRVGAEELERQRRLRVFQLLACGPELDVLEIRRISGGERLKQLL